jgi:WD40 repeat protein
MLGRLVLCSILAAAVVGGGAWYTGHLPTIVEQAAPSQERRTKPEPVTSAAKGKEAAGIGKPLVEQVAMAAPAQPAPRAEDPQVSGSELIVIPESRLVLIKKQDVPAQRDGVLRFVGIEIRPGEQLSKDEKTWDVQVLVNGQKTTKKYRRLRIGDVVAENELLGLVDDTLASAEYAIKNAKVAAAIADQIAAEKTRDEARKRFDTAEKLFGGGRVGVISMEDLRAAELTWIRYVYEAKSKLEAIKVAEQEKNQAIKQLEMYEIRAAIPGVVKAIYKREGEAVSSTNNGKNSDPVILLHNYNLLNVEGLVDAQDARALQQGMKVRIEPMSRERPKFVLKGHRLEVTSVAVSKDVPNRQIVSGSEDGSVRIWDLESGKLKRVLPHNGPVRAVACTPEAAAANLCISGTSDGMVWLWDLNGESDQPLRKMQGQHHGAVTAVAFSPDGKYAATGDRNGELMLWNVSDGELRYQPLGHHSMVTALNFAQGQLVSVSRDNTARTWRLGTDGAVQMSEIKRRSNEVDQVGISSDGKYILDSQGQEMRVLSLPGGLTETIFQNPSQANVFKSFALFSPDNRLVVTTSSSEGILQLWRLDKPRTYEIRQLMPTDRYPATCAAFVPDGTYVIGGSKDRNIYVWPMPSKDEVDLQVTATLTSIGKEVENSQGQVKVIAEMENPPQHPLFAGDVVTMVADPRK